MPNVIVNTSPIQYLHQTNLLDLLPTFNSIKRAQLGSNKVNYLLLTNTT